MSDHWEFYPCEMDGHQAFIFYDHGIRDEIDGLEHASVWKVCVPFRNPTEEGLPTSDEFEQLCALEDDLTAQVRELGGVYVGRATVAGARFFHCFVSFQDDVAKRIAREVSARSGYELQCVLKPDPEKKAYWDELFPTPNDWRVIQDLKVLDALKERGDDPSIPRRIDHWAYFKTSSGREAFRVWALQNELAIQQLTDPDDADADYGIQIYHYARPELEGITATTQLLLNKAEELGGTYDGWETRVETGSEGGKPGFGKPT